MAIRVPHVANQKQQGLQAYARHIATTLTEHASKTDWRNVLSLWIQQNVVGSYRQMHGNQNEI